MPFSEDYTHYRCRSSSDHGSPRRRYYVSHGRPWFACLHRPSPVIVLERSRSAESDDEYCRRKDRFYELIADDLAAAKKERDSLKAAMESARYYEGYKKRKAEYEEQKDRVKVLEKRVEEEKKNVLRRNRI